MEVDVLGSPSLIAQTLIAQELCESRGGRPGLPFPNSPYGPCCGRNAAMNERGKTETYRPYHYPQHYVRLLI